MPSGREAKHAHAISVSNDVNIINSVNIELKI